MGDVDDVFQRQLRRGLDVQLNVVDPVQDSQIARGKLEFIDRHLIALFCILLHHMHGQGMNDNAVVNLDHQLPLVKEVGRFFIRSVVVKVIKFSEPRSSLSVFMVRKL